MRYQLRLAATAVALVCSGLASAGSLTIESWRVDDKALWEEVLLPAFNKTCLLYTSPSPRDRQKSRMPSSA